MGTTVLSNVIDVGVVASSILDFALAALLAPILAIRTQLKIVGGSSSLMDCAHQSLSAVRDGISRLALRVWAAHPLTKIALDK